MSDTPRTDALMDSIAVEHGGIKSIPLERAGWIEIHARRMERDRSELVESVRDLLAQIASLEDYTLTRDIEPYKAQAVWDDTLDRAAALLSRIEEGK